MTLDEKDVGEAAVRDAAVSEPRKGTRAGVEYELRGQMLRETEQDEVADAGCIDVAGLIGDYVGVDIRKGIADGTRQVS